MSGKNIIDSCTECTSRWKNFEFLTKKEMELVNENRYEASFKPGEIMIKQNSPASSALFLSSGLAKIYIEGIKGRNFIMSIAKPGRMIMGPGVYVNSRHTYTVSAITAVQACFISFDVFRHFVRTNGAFAESLIEDISKKSLRTHTRMVNLAHKKMPGRLAEALLYFADEIFNKDDFEMLLSRKELGEMTNMAKESAVRILKEFEESGIIQSTSAGIKILDKEKLNLISEKG
jgi:CRP/FNR family transcriptional regulator, polysaccharide utilization system transcription regulator